MPNDELTRRMHAHPGNAGVLRFLKVCASDALRPFDGDGFDAGGTRLLYDFGAELPEACKYSLRTANVMVSPNNGLIFAVHFGRYAFLIRRDWARVGRDPPVRRPGLTATPLDGDVDMQVLEDAWCDLSFCVDEGDERMELGWAFELAART